MFRAPAVLQTTKGKREPMPQCRVTIRFISGREELFDVDFPLGPGAETRLHEFCKSPTVVLQTKEELIVLPSSAIEAIRFTRPPANAAQLKMESILSATRVK